MDIVFKDNSKKFTEEKRIKLFISLSAIGLIAEGYAKRITPVDTGRLRNSISYAVVGNSVYIGTNVEYGPYIELGTIHIPAYHMLEHAAKDHPEEYKAIVEHTMKT